MENGEQPGLIERKMNRVKSCNTQMKRHEPGKRTSFVANDAVKSLDLALCRLKKSKLVNEECEGRYSVTQEGSDMFMDMRSVPNHSHSVDNRSLISMNFSHYELMRNLSCSNCNSEGAYSGATNERLTAADLNLKDEHLERYFRSIEMWSRSFRECGPSKVPVEIPEK